MSLTSGQINAFLAKHQKSILVQIAGVKGSTPRDTDALMLVSADDTLGTIGGGQAEYIAITKARTLLRSGNDALDIQMPLGPEIGQCCGGHLSLTLQRMTPALASELTTQANAAGRQQADIYVFGAGHVGRALAIALAPLPFNTMLVDTRPDYLKDMPEAVRTLTSPLPESIVRKAKPGSGFVVMTHDHALDFLIMREVLMRGDAAYAGLIGSATKRARFAHWFAGEGGGEQQLAHLVCPIGALGLGDKRPEVIAALTAAEIICSIGQKHCPIENKDATLAMIGGSEWQ